MPNEVKTVRTSGFRLFNIGVRNKKKTIAVIIIAAVIASLNLGCKCQYNLSR